MAETLPYANLYYQNGTSDKVYKIEIKKQSNIYQICSRYGRRGSTLTENPYQYFVSKHNAVHEFHKIVGKKLAKGYKEEGPNSVIVQPTQGKGWQIIDAGKWLDPASKVEVSKPRDILSTGRRIKDFDE